MVATSLTSTLWQNLSGNAYRDKQRVAGYTPQYYNGIQTYENMSVDMSATSQKMIGPDLGAYIPSGTVVFN
jgi:prephenate dehydrogenase